MGRRHGLVVSIFEDGYRSRYSWDVRSTCEWFLWSREFHYQRNNAARGFSPFQDDGCIDQFCMEFGVVRRLFVMNFLFHPGVV